MQLAELQKLADEVIERNRYPGSGSIKDTRTLVTQGLFEWRFTGIGWIPVISAAITEADSMDLANRHQGGLVTAVRSRNSPARS